MRSLSSSALAQVTGGFRSSSTVRIGPIAVQFPTTDHEACAALMRRVAARRFPATGVFPLTPDVNAAARDRTAADYIRRFCPVVRSRSGS